MRPLEYGREGVDPSPCQAALRGDLKTTDPRRALDASITRTGDYGRAPNVSGG
jgi:hypothetical protein